MINIHSMNIRCLGADPNILAIKDLFRSSKSKILLIQETMHGCQETISYFRCMFPTQHMAEMGATGLSGGLAVLWDLAWILVVAFKCFVVLLPLAYIRGSPRPFHILNVYAPYKECFPFWDHFLSSEILDLDSLLIGGDLNCTLSNDEIWGRGRRDDLVGGMIRDAILQHNFFDVYPFMMGPTWDNGRSQDAFLTKRLDRFLIHDRLIDRLGIPTSKIILSFISDHRPISIQWNHLGHRNGFPFKFNRVWLEDAQFNNLI